MSCFSFCLLRLLNDVKYHWLGTVYLLVLIDFHLWHINRTEDEGSEETMDTETQRASTLSSDVYKQVDLAH